MILKLNVFHVLMIFFQIVVGDGNRQVEHQYNFSTNFKNVICLMISSPQSAVLHVAPLIPYDGTQS